MEHTYSPIAGARKRRTLSDDVTRAILQLIKDEGLRPGDRLPAVQSLSERFDVAAATVREALRRLQATNAITIRHGSGIYVSAHADRRIFANPHRGAADPQTVRELLETRRLLEPAAARLAAGGVRSPALEKLRETLKAAQEQLDDEFALTVTNMHFHTAVGRLSGNRILAETIDALMGSYTEEQHQILLLYDDRKKDYDEHCRILEAIASGDGEFAYSQMYEHLTGVIEKVARPAARSPREGNH